ncbi:MAG: nitrate ABC transporter, permease protein, partial [Rhodospirillales bacterium]
MTQASSGGRAALLSLVLLAVFLGAWQLAVGGAGDGGGLGDMDPEYAALMGLSAGSGSAMPSPIEIGREL